MRDKQVAGGGLDRENKRLCTAWTRCQQWQRFFREPGIVFKPVPRCKGGKGEANDDIIVRAMRDLSTAAGTGSIALLTCDVDFMDAIQRLHLGSSILVLIPSRAFNVIRAYQDAGVRVLEVPVQQNSPRVRAMLEDGTGHVQFADPYISFDGHHEACSLQYHSCNKRSCVHSASCRPGIELCRLVCGLRERHSRLHEVHASVLLKMKPIRLHMPARLAQGTL